jgi:hypothetical protein
MPEAVSIQYPKIALRLEKSRENFESSILIVFYE